MCKQIKLKRFTAIFLSLLMLLSTISIPGVVFASDAHPLVISAHQFGNEHVLVQSHIPQAQHVAIGSGVYAVDISVSIIGEPNEVLLVGYEIFHNGWGIREELFPFSAVLSPEVSVTTPAALSVVEFNPYANQYDDVYESVESIHASYNGSYALDNNIIFVNSFSSYRIFHYLSFTQLHNAGDYNVIVTYIVDGVSRTMQIGLFTLDVFEPLMLAPLSTVEVRDVDELRDALTSGTAWRTISLEADINLGSWSPPVLSDYNVARFTLDGNGHTITMQANGTDYAGLLGRVNNGHIIIRDLGIINQGVYALSNSNTSWLVGAFDHVRVFAGGLIGLVNGGVVEISNTFIVGGNINARRPQQNSNVLVSAGGFFGSVLNNATVHITDSYVNVNRVRAEAFGNSFWPLNANQPHASAGGLIGEVFSNSRAYITHSYAVGEVISYRNNNSVSTTGRTYVGGLVGVDSNVHTDPSVVTVVSSIRTRDGEFSGDSGNRHRNDRNNNLVTYISANDLNPLRNRNTAPLNTWDFNNTWGFVSGVNDGFPVLQTFHRPYGYLDELSGTTDGRVSVRGWAFDRAALASHLSVHVYIGGPAGSGAERHVITANTLRTDVGNAFPGVGNNRGFDELITTSRRGWQDVYVYAMGANFPNSNIFLGSSSVNITVATTGITITQPTTNISLHHYSTSQFLASVVPPGATTQGITWSSSNPSVISVNQSTGLVRAETWQGSATITAQTVAGGWTASRTVTAIPLDVSSVQINNPTGITTLPRGAALQLSHTITPGNASFPAVTWSSSDTSVATVDSNGLVTAVGAITGTTGSATITLASNSNPNATSSLTINIFNPVESISLTPTTLSLLPWEYDYFLTATINPSDATNRSITWSSSDSDIVSVNSTGLITAHRPGTATITVSSAEAGVASATSTITVGLFPVLGITLPDYEYIWLEDERRGLIAEINPSEFANENVIWHSDNPNVATIDGNGLSVDIVVHDVGEAIITVTTECGGHSDYITVRVELYPVPAVDVALYPSEITLHWGAIPGPELRQTRLELEFIPPDIYSHMVVNTNMEVTWESSNPLIATVDDTGLVTAHSIGAEPVIITVQLSEYPYSYASTEVFVTPILVSSVRMRETEITLGEQSVRYLNPIISPFNAANQNVTFVSSNPAVATVDQYGMVTGVLAGVATITATTNDGGHTAYTEIVVRRLPFAQFATRGGYVFLDDVGSVSLQWNMDGDGTLSYEVSVMRNLQNFTNFTNSNTITIQPSAVGGLKDTYVVRVTVRDSHGYVATDAVSFTVYNRNALSSEFPASINLDYSGEIIGRTSEQRLSARSGLMLMQSLGFSADRFPWTGTDTLTWQIADDSIAEVQHFLFGSWTSAPTEIDLSPFTPVRIVGVSNGATTLTITHTNSGMTAIVPVLVHTLREQLYFMRVSPPLPTMVTYTTSDGREITTQTNTRGELVIYEPGGIVGDIQFMANVGNALFTASANSAEMLLMQPGEFQLYPMHTIRLGTATSQTFFTYTAHPTGPAYNGRVSITGGLFRNGVYVPGSAINIPSLQVGSGGQFNIILNSGNFGELRSSDTLQFAYMVQFLDGNYAPQLLWVDGFADNRDNVTFDNAILRLQEWDTRGFIPVRYIYEDAKVFDVTNNNAFVGMTEAQPEGILTAIVASRNLDVSSLQFVDEFGFAPTNQRVRSLNEELPFLGDVYEFWALELPVDEYLNLRPGESRYFHVYGRDLSGNVRRVDLPFGLFNGSELIIPAEMLNFDFSMDGLVSDNSLFATVLGESGVSGVALDIIGALVPSGIDFGDSLPFSVTIQPKDGNPLVFEVTGILTLKPSKDTDTSPVFWSSNGEGRGTHKIHRDENCRGFTSTRRHGYSVVRGTVEEAVSRGILGGFCLICAEDCAKKAEREFEQARENYNALRNNERHGASSWDRSVKFEGFIKLEIGYDIHTGEWVMEWKEVGIKFKGDINYRYSYRIPIPGPVPGLAVTIEFAAGVGVEIGVKVLPSLIISGDANRDWLILEAKTNGYMRLRGAIGLDIWVAAANVGVFGQVDLHAEFISQILQWQAAARYRVDFTIGVDMAYRIGPPVRVFGKPLYVGGRVIFWQIDPPITTGWRRIFGDQNLFSSSSATSASVPFLAARFTMFDAFIDQQLHNIPTEQLPSGDISLAGTENFAVASWVSVGMTDDEWAFWEYSNTIVNNLGEEVFDLELADIIALANLTEISASVYIGGIWTPPVYLSDYNLFFPNINPIVAVCGNRAAVVWQQMTFIEDSEGIVATSTDLWYSLFNGSTWSEARIINANVNGTIVDYSVAMNGMDIALVLSVYGIDGTSGVDVFSIYTIHVNASEQVTQNRLVSDENLNTRPQIESLSSGFVVAKYVDDFSGSGDIVLQKLTNTGEIYHGFRQGVDSSSHIHGIMASPNYRLITNNNDIAVAWVDFDTVLGMDVLYAALLVPHAGTYIFTAPITLNSSLASNDVLFVLDGTLDSNRNIRVLYNSVNSSTLLSGATSQAVGVNRLAHGQFTNSIIYELRMSNADIAPEVQLPVYFTFINTGITSITQIAIDWHGGSNTWNGLNILPNGVFSGVAYVALGSEIRNLCYDIVATFQGGQTARIDGGTLIIAMPDISIGRTTVIRSSYGEREFSVNLFNVSDVNINDNYRVQLSFFQDPMFSIPANVVGETNISGSDMIGLINAGGLSMTYMYTFAQSDLNRGEVPGTGVRLFMEAAIYDSAGNLVREINYQANRSNLLLEGLIRYGQDTIVANADNFDGLVADISVANRSMQNVSANSGRIVAQLLNSSGEVIDTQTRNVTNVMQGESTLNYQIAFAQQGHNVRVSFERLAIDTTDSRLASLQLLSIPFSYEPSGTTSGSTVQLTANNINNVNETTITAIAKNPNAVITIDGNAFSDVASVTIPLFDRVDVVIVVTVGTSSTTYRLAVSSDQQPAPMLALNPSTVTLGDNALIATTTVGGTAIGAITLEASNLPTGINATVSGSTITISGTRPSAGQSAINGTFSIPITRGGLTETLSVVANLTPQATTGDNNDNQGNDSGGWWAPPTRPSLSSPTNVRIDGTIVSWNAVNNATGYRVYVSGRAASGIIAVTSFNLATLELPAGTHAIRIRAIHDGTGFNNSALSATVNFVVTDGGIVFEIVLPPTAAENHMNVEAQLASQIIEEDESVEVVVILPQSINDVHLYGKTLELLIETEQPLTLVRGIVQIILSVEFLEEMLDRGVNIANVEDFIITENEYFNCLDCGHFTISIVSYVQEKVDGDDELYNVGADNVSVLFTVSATAYDEELVDLSAAFTIKAMLEDLLLPGTNHHRIVAFHESNVIGGRFTPETGLFVVNANALGMFAIVYVETLSRLTMRIGYPFIVDMAGNAPMQTMDVLPVIVDNRTLIPIRFVAYALGAEVDWIRPTEDTPSLAQIVLHGRELLIPLNGTITPELAALGMDVPAQIIGDRTMVPLRFVSEFFGALVNWDSETSGIEIIRDTAIPEVSDVQSSTPLTATFAQAIAALLREDEDDLTVTFAA